MNEVVQQRYPERRKKRTRCSADVTGCVVHLHHQFEAPSRYQMWQEAEGWQRWLTAQGASRGTLRLRAHYLDNFADTHECPWDVTVDHIADWLANPNWSAETKKSARASLRSFYSWAVATGRVQRDPTNGIPPIRIAAGIARPCSEEVVRAALDRARQSDRAGYLMILLGAYAGLRLSEITAVHSDDVTDLGLIIKGKGGVTRRVPIHPLLAAPLSAVNGWAFPSPVRSGMHVGPDYVSHRVTGLLGHGWTCHQLRHRFATRAYAASHDLRAVQTLLGHSKPETTARYVAVAQDDLTSAVNGVD